MKEKYEKPKNKQQPKNKNYRKLYFLEGLFKKKRNSGKNKLPLKNKRESNFSRNQKIQC